MVKNYRLCWFTLKNFLMLHASYDPDLGDVAKDFLELMKKIEAKHAE